MKVKFKKQNKEVPTPQYATGGSACFDLTNINGKYNTEENYYEYNTGIAVEIPKHYVGLLFPRSSNTKKDLILGNSVGVIDSDYRGLISFRYKPIKETHYLWGSPYKVGDRIGQLMIVPCPQIELVESEELSNTERGEGGYGSTGN